MKTNKYFVIDFDSTFTKVEAFDVLAEIIVKEHPQAQSIKKQIEEITNLGPLSLAENVNVAFPLQLALGWK